MRFERKLAKRYIFAQRRHSLLTVCSIAIAVAMMTMIFVLVQTLFGSKREHIRNTVFPYHAVLVSQHPITQAELDQLKAEPAIRDCGFFEPDAFYKPDGSSRYEQFSTAALAYNWYHPDAEALEEGAVQPDADAKPVWVDFKFKLFEKGIEQSTAIRNVFGSRSDVDIQQNHDLMIFDYIGADGKFSMALFFTMIYILVILFAMTLRMVIDTAFEISSKERERQFGVLQSIGATRKQTMRIITNEGLLLSVIGVPAGLLLGIFFAYITYRAVLSTNVIFWTWGSRGMEDVSFSVGIAALAVAAVTGLGWVLLSAHGTGLRMLKKKSPIESVRASQSKITKVRKHSVFGLLFGWTGGLAARNIRRNKKRYIVTVLSLAVSVTLIATVSYAADSYRKIGTAVASDLSSMYGVRSDIILSVTGDTAGEEGQAPLLAQLNETGYFRNLRVMPGVFGYISENAYNRAGMEVPEEIKGIEQLMLDVEFFNEQDYNSLFDGEPPVSYAELKATGGCGVVTGRGCQHSLSEIPMTDGKIRMAALHFTPVTPERKEEILAENPEKHFSSICTGWDAEKQEKIMSEAEYRFIPFEIKFGAELHRTSGASFAFVDEAYIRLLMPIESYAGFADELKTEDAEFVVQADVTDESSYEPMKQWLSKQPRITVEDDMYPVFRQIETGTAAVDLAVRMLTVLISLIAAVSMINVISTGILNRRAELAGMQAVGMTKRQLNKLMLTECVQYVIGGIIGALAIVCGAVYAMRWLVGKVGLPELADELGLTYTKPLLTILIAGIAAFGVSVLAAFIPLRRMQREPIVESLRGFD